MRNAGLDLLRLSAVILVLGRHLLPAENENVVLNVWRTGGWVGVDLFFVLSGFLVSGLLFSEYKKKGAVDIKRFMIRRGFKIYPPLVLLIVVTVVVTLLQGETLKSRQTISELLMMQNYGGALWNHTWSLAVEWHFYILLSVLCMFLLNNQTEKDVFKPLPYIFAACAVFCLLARLLTSSILPSSGPENYKWLYYGTHIRVDSLMFGVFVGYLWHFRDLNRKIKRVPAGALLASGLLLLVPAFVFDLEKHRAVSVFGFTLFYLASGLLLLAATRLESVNGRLLAFLVGLGGASYSIYLWHMSVNWWLWPGLSGAADLSLKTHYGLYMLFFVVVSLGLGYWLNRLVEQPSLRLRERLFPGKAAAGSVRLSTSVAKSE